MFFVQTVWKIFGDFTEKRTKTFQNDVEYVPKMSFWALLGLFLWLSLKNLFWELPQISLPETIRVFCSNVESCLGCAGSRKLRLIMGFKSWTCDIQYQLLRKHFFVFWKRGLRRFGLCTFFLKVSVQIFEKWRPMSPKPIDIPLKMTLREAQSLRFELCFACLSSCEWKSCCDKFKINVRELIPIFVRVQSQVLAGLVSRGYVWYFGFYVVCLTSHTMPNKKQSIFWECCLCRFGSVQSFWWLPYKPFWKGEKVGRCQQNQDTNFLKCRWVSPKI